MTRAHLRRTTVLTPGHLIESMITDTSSIIERTDFAEFIRSAIPGLSSTLSKPPKKPGSPRVIVIAGAALRVADLCR